MAVQIMNIPDYFGAAERGKEAGRADKEYGRQEELKTIAPQIMAGDQDAYTRGAQIDKKAADGYMDEHTKRLKQLRAAALYMKDKIATGDDMQIQAAWASGVRPFLSKLVPGKETPEAFDKAMVPAIEEALAMTAFIDAADDSKGSQVQSTKIGKDGYYYTVNRNGQWEKSDVQANPNIQVLEQEGQLPVGVVKSGGVAGELVPLGGGAPVAPAPAAGDPPAPTGVPRATSDAEDAEFIKKMDAYRTQLMQLGLTPEQILPLQDAYEQALNGAAGAVIVPGAPPAPAGNNLQTSSLVRTPTAGDKAGAVAAAQRDAQNERPALAPGYRYTADGNQEFIPGGPADPAQAGRLATSKRVPSPAQLKDITTRKTKAAAVNNIERNIEDVEKALTDLDSYVVGTGPLTGYGLGKTTAGDALDGAIGRMRASFTSLTRVPGIGSQSDLEARLDALQYPSTSSYSENNKTTLKRLREFAKDLKSAWDTAIDEDAQYDLEAPATQAAPAAGGWGIRKKN